MAFAKIPVGAARGVPSVSLKRNGNSIRVGLNGGIIHRLLNHISENSKLELQYDPETHALAILQGSDKKFSMTGDCASFTFPDIGDIRDSLKDQETKKYDLKMASIKGKPAIVIPLPKKSEEVETYD